MTHKAFLIGVNTLGLRYAESDAQLMYQVLESYHYEVCLSSQDKRSLSEQLEEMADSCNQTDTLLFYFSGHGVLSAGKLELVLGEDTNKQKYLLGMGYVTSCLEKCRARNKLIILDCCHALASYAEWRPDFSENFRILTASNRLEKAKEIEHLKSSFLTYHLHQAFTSRVHEIVEVDDKIRISPLYHWLKKATQEYNARSSDQVPMPNLLGNEKANFELATLSPNTSTENLESSKSLRIVISYKRGLEKDEYLLKRLEEGFIQAGHRVFVVRHRKVTDEWEQQVSEQISQAHVVVVLLSAASIYSEMLAYEVEWAYRCAQEHHGVPHFIPIRIHFTDPLPQNLANLLGKIPFFSWKDPADDARLLKELLEKLATPDQTRQRGYELEMLGGAIPLDSKFYLERLVDKDFQAAIARHDSIVLLKGARQVGKTSLLARGLQQARDSGVEVLLTDFQWLDDEQLESLENFFIAMGEMLAEQLNLDLSPRDKWHPQRSPKMNFDKFFREELLAKTEKPILWAIDEADRLFLCPFSSDVFSLFRVLHNERASRPTTPCSRLTFAIAYATESYFFIQDPSQSPFNVGTKLILTDFTLEQVKDLHQCYGNPLNDANLNRFFELTGGQPYLVRRGFNEIIAHGLAFDDFLKTAEQGDGPFGDHLQQMIMLLNKQPELVKIVIGILNGNPCPDDDSFYRLRGLGILQGESKNHVHLRCELYARCFRKYLI